MAAVCPLCKAAASEVRYKRAFGGAVVSKHKVAPPVTEPHSDDDGDGRADDQRACGGCGSQDHDDLLMLCDGCDEGCYHTYCLDPPLSSVPEGAWFCLPCDTAAENGNS